MNKIIALLIVLIVLITPSIAAQDMPDDIEQEMEVNWRIVTTRTVIWIGESIDVFVNGSANTSFSMELRRFNTTDRTLYNASYSAHGRTGSNGTAYMEIPDDFTEIPGEYRIQIVRNNLAVAIKDILVNFDPQRYDALQREDIWDYLGVDADNPPDTTVYDYQRESIDYDRYEMKELEKLEILCYLIIVMLVFIIMAQMNVWVNRFVDWRTKDGKGSLVVRATSRAGDRTRDYGGAIIGGEEPKISDKCLGLTKAIDENQNIEWNLEGKTSSQVMPQIMRNAKALGCKMPAKSVPEVKTPVKTTVKTPVKTTIKKSKKVKDNE